MCIRDRGVDVQKFILKFDLNGNMIWEKSLPDDIYISCLQGKIGPGANGFLAAGSISLGTIAANALILNFDNDGNIMDTQTVSDDYYTGTHFSSFRDIAENPITVMCGDGDLDDDGVQECNDLIVYTFVGITNAGLTDDKDILLALYYADDNDQNNNAQYDPEIAYKTTLGKNINFTLDETYHEDATCVFVPEDFMLNLEEEEENVPENHGIIIGGSYFVKDLSLIHI